MKFPDAQKKMIKVLHSAAFKNRSDAVDTISSIPMLEKIIQAGLITDGSQEGLCKSGYNKEANRYYLIKERAQLSGFMQREKARDFVERFNTETDIIAFITSIDSSKAYDTLFWTDPNASSSIPVTVSSSANTKSELTTSSLYPDSKIRLVWPVAAFNASKQAVFLDKEEEVEHVVIIDPVYCHKATSANGLYKNVLHILTKLQ